MTIVGARPQFVKAAVLARALASTAPDLTHRLLHTGQHYDDAVSGVFFRDLGLSSPAWNLGVGSGSHGRQTGRMLCGIERVLQEARPALVVVHGDTNSTLAGALAAVKLRIPVAHVEAGLRSYERTVPEEVNRVLTDRAADLHLAPTRRACRNLAAEGIHREVHQVGDVMLDAVRLFAAEAPGKAVAALASGAAGFVLATIHRAENTGTPGRLRALLALLGEAGRPVYFPVHPRTRPRLASVPLPDTIRLLPPLPYRDMLALIRRADVVVTDSGGLQKEAFWLGTPCLTLRERTEWVETVEAGRNRLVGCDRDAFHRALDDFRHGLPALPPDFAPQPFGDGHAAEKIALLLADRLG